MGGSTEVIDEPEEAADASLSFDASGLAVCLVSGGMDSCVTAAIARTENDEVAFLHISYGQRTEARERRAFADLADHFAVTKRLAVSIESLKAIGGSSLTDDSMPVTKANLRAREIPTSYVPFRNAHLLAIAASWAEAIGASESILAPSLKILPVTRIAGRNSTGPFSRRLTPARSRKHQSGS